MELEDGAKSAMVMTEPVALNCPSCGTQAEPTTVFCTNCGVKLKEVRFATSQISMRERGSELEDVVGAYFRSKGYDVQTRTKMRDRRDVFHEIDVLASKREDFGTIQIAIECKNVRSPIDIKEIRNFNDKLSALGVTKGIFVSTGGFTSDAQSDAASVNMELWDEQALEEKISKQETPEKDILHDALPINPALLQSLTPKHLSNAGLFSESKKLDYRPFYFLDYHCFSQHTVRGDSVVLESKGTVVVDANGGQVVDSRTISGHRLQLPTIGTFVGCMGISPQTITTSDFQQGLSISVLPSNIETARAKEIAKGEIVKGLTLEHEYHLMSDSKKWFPEKHVKLIKPRKKDVDVLDTRLLKIPILTDTYRFSKYTYNRTYLASTGGLILDQTGKCLLCTRQPAVICENCGAVVCESHLKRCSTCSRSLCVRCVLSKGIVSKSYYCPEHQPGK